MHKDGSATISCDGSSRSSSTQKSYVDNSLNRSLGRVGKPVGSHVMHRDGSATISCDGSSRSSSSLTQKSYVDNSLNRSLGRVGKPVGSHVMHKDGSTTLSKHESVVSEGSKDLIRKVEKPKRYHGATMDSDLGGSFIDNAYNRKLGRVGQPLARRVNQHRRKEQELLSERNLDDIVRILRDLDFRDPTYPAVVSAQYELRKSQVEEVWKKDGIAPCTNHAKATESMKEIIPLNEIDCSKQIGEGSFGKVFAGLWKRSIPVAFKKFIYQQITKKQRDLLVKEIKIFSGLVHTNIVKMFGVVVEKDNVGIVMEYLPKTLFQALFIEEVNFDEQQKRKIIDEVISALEYLHVPDDSRQSPKPSIAHRDVKSQNVLLDSNNVAKLCDFGLSTMKNSIQSSSFRGSAFSAEGTPRYAAPEVLRGELLQISGLIMSDIYSLSLVIYEILVEDVPYEEFGVMQLYENIGRGTLRPPIDEYGLSEAVKQLLMRGWHKEPMSRPTIRNFAEEILKIENLFEDKQPIN
jgi:predicted Ser/Thr protein kinase